MTSQSYDKELEMICSKYNIIEKKSQHSSEKIKEVILSELVKKCHKRRVALWGVGDIEATYNHARQLMETYATQLSQVVCFIDNRKDIQGKEYMNLPIIGWEDIDQYDVEIILISSFNSRDAIEKDIQQKLPTYNYLNLYFELEQEGIILYGDFFSNTSQYIKLYQLKEAYESSADIYQKSIKLKQIIRAYLEIRDIPYMLKFIDEYVQNKFIDWQDMQQVYIEIEQLLKDIKVRVSNKKKNIIIYFIDSMRAVDVVRVEEDKISFRYFEELSKKSKFFINSFSTAPVTYESIYSIITGNMPYHENLYNRDLSFDIEESIFLRESIQQGYEIKTYFSKMNEFIKQGIAVKNTPTTYLSEKLWYMLCDLAEQDIDSKYIQFIHASKELHVPFLCGYHTKEPQPGTFLEMGMKDTSDFIEEQFRCCLEYVDLQMSYYQEFIHDDMRQIIFSDHAHLVYDFNERKPYYMYYNDLQRSVHNIMIVKGKGITPEVEEQLFSMKDFNIVATQVLKNEPIQLPTVEAIGYQYYDIHNKTLREFAKQCKGEDHINGIQCYTDGKFIYVITATGKKELYRVEEYKGIPLEIDNNHPFVQSIETQYLKKFPGYIKDKWEKK